MLALLDENLHLEKEHMHRDKRNVNTDRKMREEKQGESLMNLVRNKKENL